MYNFSDEAKRRIKNGKVVRAYLKVLATETEEEFIINEENYLKDFEFADERWVENEGFIGQAVAKSIVGNFNNVDGNFNIENREFELYMGIDLEDGTTEYHKYGTFIVQKPSDNKTNDNTYFEALDYMIKFNSLFVEKEIVKQYPYTLKELFQWIVESEGMQIKENNFLNQDYEIFANPFAEGMTKREVLKAIAQVAFSWVRIDADDNVTIDFNKDLENIEEISIDDYFELEKQPNIYGPLNTIVFKLGDGIEGENETIPDPESIAIYGITELDIIDNPIANTKEKRFELIQAGKKIFGLTYIPFKMDLIGLIYLDCTYKIKLLGEKGFTSYIFNHVIKYNGTALDSISTEAMTNSETKYKYISSMKNALKRTELIIDKVNQSIEGVIEKQDEQLEQIVEIQENLNGIQASVDQINNLVKETSGDTTIKLEDCKEANLITLHIYGNNTVFQQKLYPSDNLYPSDDLYMEGSSRLYVYTDIVLPSNNLYPSDNLYPEYGTKDFVDLRAPSVLRHLNGNVYDEYIIEEGMSYILRRIGVTFLGDMYELPTPEIEIIGQIDIQLQEGTNYLSLAPDNMANLKVTYATRTSLTDVYAEVIRMQNKVKITEDSYSIEVSQLIDDESKKTTYEQTPTEIIMTADKIEINGIDFADLLARVEQLEKGG